MSSHIAHTLRNAERTEMVLRDRIAALEAENARLREAGDKLQYELEMERESRGSLRPQNLAAIREWKAACAALTPTT